MNYYLNPDQRDSLKGCRNTPRFGVPRDTSTLDALIAEFQARSEDVGAVLELPSGKSLHSWTWYLERQQEAKDNLLRAIRDGNAEPAQKEKCMSAQPTYRSERQRLNAWTASWRMWESLETQHHHREVLYTVLADLIDTTFDEYPDKDSLVDDVFSTLHKALTDLEIQRDQEGSNQ